MLHGIHHLHDHRHKLYWAICIVVSFVIVLATGLIILRARWPFSKDKIAATLGDTVHATVHFNKFHSTYFPHPGCEAEVITFVRPDEPSGTPPLVTIQKVSMQARYWDIFLRPGFLARIIVDGLYVRIPPRGASQSNGATQERSSSSDNTRVGQIVANGAVLEIDREGGAQPLKFEIHSLTLRSVSRDEAMTYNLAMQNALPPGEIRSEGHLGPWKSGDLGQTPLYGSYTFEQANLSAFTGIAGTLISKGAFKGVLAKLSANGNVDIPDFKLTESEHSVDLSAAYQATVNALNGDVILHQVNTSILDTRVTATGSVAGKQGEKGKLTSIDLAVRGGRIQDLMLLFVTKGKPPVNGATSIRAHVTVPPEGKPFLKELEVTGDFTIGGGQFTKASTQKSVDLLSQRASGADKNSRNKNKAAEADDPPDVQSNLEGHVVLRNKIAHFTRASFSVPGASAIMDGTYNLDNDRVNFQGTLKTKAEFSKTTSGIKSILLKPFDPFFKKNPSGSSVPINMTGRYPNPKFGLDLDQDKKHGK